MNTDTQPNQSGVIDGVQFDKDDPATRLFIAANYWREKYMALKENALTNAAPQGDGAGESRNTLERAHIRQLLGHDASDKGKSGDSSVSRSAVHEPAAAASDLMAEGRALLAEMQPYLDSLICYASTRDEYKPNDFVARVHDYLSRTA